MRTRPFSPIVLVLASVLALGCDSRNPVQPTALSAADPARDLKPTPAAGAVSSTDFGMPEFDPGNFVGVVDNPLFPLPLGTRLIYHGTEAGKPEKVITDITRGEKTILGVPVVVVLDRVFLGGVLKEQTLDWYAQDAAGNVWYFGEDTKEFENGIVISTAGSFEAGKDGATAGIIMRAQPKLGQVTPQEFAPGVAEDRARVIELDATVDVPFGTFRHCLKSEEFTPLDPTVLENKFYCPGIGITRERDAKGGSVSTALTDILR